MHSNGPLPQVIVIGFTNLQPTLLPTTNNEGMEGKFLLNSYIFFNQLSETLQLYYFYETYDVKIEAYN